MILLFLISLIICIFCHEFAHLITAKKCGCGVLVFSIGFGKPIYSFEWKKTRYNFTPFLLGGYCKLEGELDGKSNSPIAFTNLSYRKKLMIALAGVTTNMLMGSMIFLIGRFIHCYTLTYFGYLSFLLGLTNAIPFPALDGSYPILVWLEKFYGKEKGYKLMGIVCKWGFIILMILNILCIPYLIHLIKQGIL
jgi:membrane-associated protease RseP (regulator of RpoE activity)